MPLRPRQRPVPASVPRSTRARHGTLRVLGGGLSDKNVVPRFQRAFDRLNTLRFSMPAYPGSLWHATCRCSRGSPIALQLSASCSSCQKGRNVQAATSYRPVSSPARALPPARTTAGCPSPTLLRPGWRRARRWLPRVPRRCRLERAGRSGRPPCCVAAAAARTKARRPG